MESISATFLAGVVLGLASALHCATMCGGISAGLLTLFATGPSRSRALPLGTMQAGRITVYIGLGAAVGLLGSTAFGLIMEPKLASRILQWAAAVSLMWIGLTIAELVPALADFGRPLSSLSVRAGTLLAPLRRHRIAGAYASGLSWGLCPCPMVYGALFTSALTGSLQGGATLMAGFGIGTVPAVIISALGFTALTRLATGPMVRSALGLSIAAFGFATVYLNIPLAGLCLTP
ncbi:MAG: sulfite exporter TauE/SafE family protein [Hyphomicrobium sp.]|jgi:hypothetical protein